MSKIDLIIDALEEAANKIENAYVAIHIDEALTAARELRELKPVGAFKNKNGVWHQVDDENHPAYVTLYRLD